MIFHMSWASLVPLPLQLKEIILSLLDFSISFYFKQTEKLKKDLEMFDDQLVFSEELVYLSY